MLAKLDLGWREFRVCASTEDKPGRFPARFIVVRRGRDRKVFLLRRYAVIPVCSALGKRFLKKFGGKRERTLFVWVELVKRKR